MKATVINPLLIVKDIKKSVDFYENLLGFSKHLEVPDDKGNIIYTDFQIGKTNLMIVPEETREKEIMGKGSGVQFYIDIDEDIKTLFEQLKKKGLKFTKELHETPWHTLQFQFEDPDGYVLIVSQEIKGD